MNAVASWAGRRWVRIVVAFAAILVAVALLQPWWLAPVVAHRFAAASGRSVEVDRLWFGLTARLEPVLHARGVRIANAPWADTARPLADVDEATAIFAWRSLVDDHTVLRMLVLRRGRVDLERQADGRRNWRLRHPDDRGPGRVRIMALRADNADVRFVDGGVDLVVEATARPADAGGDPALPMRIEARGAWRGIDFAAGLLSGDELTFLGSGRSFRLRGHLEAGGARLEIDGRAADVGDLDDDASIDAELALAAPSLAPFRAVLGPGHEEARPLRVAGHLRAADRNFTLSALKASVGRTDLAGEVSIARRDDRRVIDAQLHSDSTHVADLLWLVGRGDAAPGRKASGPDAPADRWRGTEGTVRFDARRVHAAAFADLQGLRLTAALADGRLKLSGIDLGVAQGHATGEATVDLNRSPPQTDAVLGVSGIRLEALWRNQSPAKRVTGLLQARARVRFAGSSADALMASLSGDVDAALLDGTISSLLDAEMGLQGGKIVRSLIGGSQALAIRCAHAALVVKRGVATVRTLLIETERTRTTGGGTVDLADRTLDVVLTPQALQGGLFVLDRSIRLRGPLLKPSHALVDRAAPAKAACAA